MAEKIATILTSKPQRLKPQRKDGKFAKAAKENKTDRRLSGSVEGASLIAVVKDEPCNRLLKTHFLCALCALCAFALRLKSGVLPRGKLKDVR